MLVSAFLQATALSYITYGTQNLKTMVNTLKSCTTFEKYICRIVHQSTVVRHWFNKKIAVINTETWQCIICMIKVLKDQQRSRKLPFRNNFIINAIIDGLMWYQGLVSEGWTGLYMDCISPKCCLASLDTQQNRHFDHYL